MQEVNKLITLLEKEKNIYEDILNISLTEQKNIIKGEVEKIKEETRLKEKLISESIQIENERIQVVNRLAKLLNINDLTLSEIIKKLNNEEATKINGIRKEFIELIDRVKRVNDENKELLKLSLDYIDFILNLFTYPEKVYNIAGKTNKKKKVNVIDKRI